MSHVKKEFQELLDAYWWGKPMTDTEGKPSMTPKGETIKARAARQSQFKATVTTRNDIHEGKGTRIPLYVLLVNGKPESSSFSKNDIDYEYHICVQGDEFTDYDYNEYKVVEGYVYI